MRNIQIYVQKLLDSEKIENFLKTFNNIFDVLNRKFPAEGIKISLNDLKVY